MLSRGEIQVCFSPPFWLTDGCGTIMIGAWQTSCPTSCGSAPTSSATTPSTASTTRISTHRSSTGCAPRGLRSAGRTARARCQPSRASFLTGLYPNTIHVNRNGNARFPANERVRLITRRLADRGYDCGLAGKLHIASGWTGVEPRVDDGYRVFDFSLSALQFVGRGNAYTDWLSRIGRLDEAIDTGAMDGERNRGARYRPDITARAASDRLVCRPRHRVHRAAARRPVADEREHLRPPWAVRRSPLLSAPLPGQGAAGGDLRRPR